MIGYSVDACSSIRIDVEVLMKRMRTRLRQDTIKLVCLDLVWTARLEG